jgi:hypothetical protein
VFDGHFIPHDGDRESLWLEGGTKGVMSGLGFHPTIVERPRNKLEAIAAARAALARCQFDEERCGLGLLRLRAYRKEGDESRGCGRAGPGMTKPARPGSGRLSRVKKPLRPEGCAPQRGMCAAARTGTPR